jgi:hypothetical protein
MLMPLIVHVPPHLAPACRIVDASVKPSPAAPEPNIALVKENPPVGSTNAVVVRSCLYWIFPHLSRRSRKCRRLNRSFSFSL